MLEEDAPLIAAECITSVRACENTTKSRLNNLSREKPIRPVSSGRFSYATLCSVIERGAEGVK